METANKLVYSKDNYYTENGYKYKIKTTISLDDDCHNNMCDWSITADIRWKNKAHKAKMMEKRAKICERYDKIIRNAETDKKVMLCVFDYGLSTDNVIYYNHTNTLSFN